MKREYRNKNKLTAWRIQQTWLLEERRIVELFADESYVMRQTYNWTGTRYV